MKIMFAHYTCGGILKSVQERKDNKMKNVNSMLNYLEKNNGDRRFSHLLHDYYLIKLEGMFDCRKNEREAINDWKAKVIELAKECGDIL